MRRSWMIVLSLGAAMAAPARAGDPKVHTVGKDGLKIESKIDADDPKIKVTEPNVNVSVDLPAKTFLIKLTNGAKYRIDLIGPDLDPVLAIQDNSNKQIAFDDDGGEGLNSRLDFVAPADGTYKFVCASLKGVGNITLTVKQTGAGKSSGGATGKETKFEGQVADTDPTITWRQIERLDSRADYSRFMLRELEAQIGSAYALCIQWDGFVLNGQFRALRYERSEPDNQSGRWTSGSGERVAN